MVSSTVTIANWPISSLMGCEICGKAPRYKCPKCLMPYCSIACFKSEAHAQYEASHQATAAPTSSQPDAGAEDPNIFDLVLQDAEIQAMLKTHALQINLSVLIKLYSSFDPATRDDLLNLKITNLREHGSEYNSLIEDFVSRFLFLYQENSSLL